MSKIIKLSFLFILSKIWSGFGDENLGAFSWSLGFKPWWMCALMYIMCIHIDVICINMTYETYMMVGISSKYFVK
jgi:hypothetical protein